MIQGRINPPFSLFFCYVIPTEKQDGKPVPQKTAIPVGMTDYALTPRKDKHPKSLDFGEVSASPM